MQSIVIGSISAAAVVGCGVLIVLFYKATSKAKRNAKRTPVREKVDYMPCEEEQCEEVCVAIGAHAFSFDSLAPIRESEQPSLVAKVRDGNVNSSVTEEPQNATSIAPCTTTNDALNKKVNPSVKQKRIVLKTYSDDDFSGSNSLFDEIMAELNEQSSVSERSHGSVSTDSSDCSSEL
jgi:hypothetical protein